MKKEQKPKVPHKYTCIAKIGDLEDGKAKCVKHRTSDLLNYENFIRKAFGGWVWIKVYGNEEKNKEELLKYYTKNDPPRSKNI